MIEICSQFDFQCQEAAFVGLAFFADDADEQTAGKDVRESAGKTLSPTWMDMCSGMSLSRAEVGSPYSQAMVPSWSAGMTFALMLLLGWSREVTVEKWVETSVTTPTMPREESTAMSLVMPSSEPLSIMM